VISSGFQNGASVMHATWSGCRSDENGSGVISSGCRSDENGSGVISSASQSDENASGATLNVNTSVVILSVICVISSDGSVIDVTWSGTATCSSAVGMSVDPRCWPSASRR
jgi:hypothetical protein